MDLEFRGKVTLDDAMTAKFMREGRDFDEKVVSVVSGAHCGSHGSVKCSLTVH